tara:strand:- start:1466 stop:3352 length:1887 start_codon:yes stop_codon:yes gene_type:complete
MIKNNTELKEHIEFFNDNKLVVFPCENKRPKVKFKDIEAQSVDELYQLFNDNDELAIRTGNGIVVIDIDTKGADGKEGFRSIEKLEKTLGNLPKTLTAKTRSNGEHRYFRILDDMQLSNRTNLNNFIGVDVRSENGYVIAPPTKNYQFTEICKIAHLPKSWFDAIKRTPKVESNVINMNLLNDDGKIIDNRDEKASKIIFAELMEQCLLKHTDKIEPDFNKLIKDSWDTFKEVCDTKNPNLSLEQEGRGLKWLTDKAVYTWRKYEAGEFTDKIEDMIVEATTFIKKEEEIKSNFIKVSDLMSMKCDPINWIIDGWLMEKTICGLYAPAGTGKSAIAQALGTCVSQGYDYGNKLKVKTRYKTLYVACEDTTNIFQSRQKSINSTVGIFDEQGLDNFLYMDRVGYDNRLASFDEGTDPKITKFYYYLEKVIKNEQVKFLILDVLQDFFGGNEIVRSDVNFFLKSVLGKMVKDLGITILVIAHPSLSGQMGHKYSGSTSWRGGFRSMWYLDKLDDDNSNTLVLNKFKSNYSKSGDEENAYFKFDNGCFSAYEKDQMESADLHTFMPKVLETVGYLNEQKTPLMKRGKLYLDIIHSLLPDTTKDVIEKCIMEHQRKGTVKYIDKKGWLKSYV